MSAAPLPPLPLLLYAEPIWVASPRKVYIYLKEKRLSSKVVRVVPHLDAKASEAYPKIVGRAASKFMGPTVPKLAIPKSQKQITKQQQQRQRKKKDAAAAASDDGEITDEEHDDNDNNDDDENDTNEDDGNNSSDNSANNSAADDDSENDSETNENDDDDDDDVTHSLNQEDYHWLVESAAIIEYLEDLCDAHPELTSVPSLRHNNNLVRRAHVRAQLVRAEALWALLGATLVLGSQPYNDTTKSTTVHVPSACAVAQVTHKVALEKLDELVGQTVDFRGLAGDLVGHATIADITLFTTLHWYRVCHGIEVAKGYEHLERFMDAWSGRRSSHAGVPSTGYPDAIAMFRDGFSEKVWPRVASD